MKAVLVYNVKAGSSLGVAELEDLCAKNDITLEASIAIDDSLETRLKPFISQGAHILVFGGDGTISKVTGLVAGTKAVLVPLMGGTLNHFAKDLGVSENIEASLRGLTNAVPMKVDVGFVNDKVFINNSSIGLYPSSLRDRQRYETVLGKWPAACWAAVRTLIRFPVYELELKGRTIKTPFIFIGNNHYDLDVSGVPVRKSLRQGSLSVFIAHTTSRFKLVGLAFRTFFGSVATAGEFEIMELKQLTIHAKRPALSVARDGEWARLKSPITYKIAPRMLTVLVGRPKE